MEDYVISPANLQILEENLGTLAGNLQNVAGNITQVTGHVNLVDEKVNNVSNEVKNLADQIREFMEESKLINIVTSAKQSIMIAEQQLNKKYGHYDEIRRQTIGILQSVDINVIKKSTMSSLTEETVMKAPNYWLSKALVALSAWMTNNKDLANQALKEAINLDDEKTSLMFALICKRANRNESSLKWIDRYLSMQDPIKMESKIITVLDAFTSGLLGLDAKNMLLKKSDEWLTEINNRPTYKEEIKKIWIEFFESKLVEIDEREYQYLVKDSPNWKEVKSILSLSKTHDIIYSYFNNIITTNNDSKTNENNQLDKLLNSLVFNYDNEELELRSEIAKNKFIVMENGNVDRAHKRYEETSSIYNKSNDYLTILTNIALNNELTNNLNSTRKFAIAVLKNYIVEAYNDFMKKHNLESLPDIEINVLDFKGITKDGNNEAELTDSLFKIIDANTHKEAYSDKLINYKMVISIILAILGIYFTINVKFVPLIIGLVSAIFCFYEFSKADKSRRIKLNQVNEIKKRAKLELATVLAEIVDYKKIYDNNIVGYNKIINYLGNLNKEQYIQNNNVTTNRQVIINNGNNN